MLEKMRSTRYLVQGQQGIISSHQVFQEDQAENFQASHLHAHTCETEVSKYCKQMFLSLGQSASLFVACIIL